MSIKVAVLQSGDQIVADMKEIESEDKPIAYLFHKPQKVVINKQIVLSENKEKSSVEVTLASWILISDEDDVPVSVNQVVALVAVSYTHLTLPTKA